ncbi:unnamed protein product, partial [Symbiodinium pilosum]
MEPLPASSTAAAATRAPVLAQAPCRGALGSAGKRSWGSPPAVALVAAGAVCQTRRVRGPPSLRQRPSGLCCAAEPEEASDQGSSPGDAVVDDVEYFFVSGDKEEGEAVAADVLERVNMVTRAHQGLYKAPEGVPDTEQGVGALTGALTSFPTEQEWQVVGKTKTDADREHFLQSVREAVSQHTGELGAEALSVQTRLGGRYTSVRIRQQVWCVEQISRVLDELKGLPE